MTYTTIACKPDQANGYDEAIWKGKHIGVYSDGVQFSSTTRQGQHLATLVHPDSFEDLAKAMMRSNHREAIKAFGAALSAGVPTEKTERRHSYIDEIPGDLGPKPGNPRTDWFVKANSKNVGR